MARDERDVLAAHIADVTSQDVDGSDTVDEAKIESDAAAMVVAINAILVALENAGIVAKS